jgi:hypothetical protein
MAKIKPNVPCPCGSGKKYKKCCSGKSAGLEERKFRGTGKATFDDDIEPSIFDVLGVKVLPTKAIDSFCEEFNVTMNELKIRMKSAGEFLDSINWFYRGAPNILLDYSDETAKSGLDEKTIDDMLAIHTFVKPTSVVGFEFGNVVLFFPSQLKKYKQKLPEELHRDLALHTWTHEITHALGANYREGVKRTPESDKTFELIADSVSFKINFNDGVPDNFWRVFYYLNKYLPEGATAGNDYFSKMAESILAGAKNKAEHYMRTN